MQFFWQKKETAPRNFGLKPTMKKAGVSLQNMGKSLIYPIAVLPFAALLNRFGTLAIDMSAADSVGYWIGFILQKPGAVVFDNIALLFAIGTAFGLSKDYRGEVALIGAVFYLGLVAMLSENGLPSLLYGNTNTFEATVDGEIVHFSSLFYVPVFGPGDQIIGAIYILNVGVLGGITAGCLSAYFYNKYSGVKLPEALSFFGGRRFVPMIALIALVPVAFIFAIVWPWIQYALVQFGTLISSGDAWAIPGAFLYGVINRFMQPFGAHHILNTFLWFQMPIEGNIVTSMDGFVKLGEDFKDYISVSDGIVTGITEAAYDALNKITEGWATTVHFGTNLTPEQNFELFNQYFVYDPTFIADSKGTILTTYELGKYIVMGDINAFQKGMVSGTFQTGFFPVYWGGLVGASVAMVMAAEKSRRKELATFFMGVGIVALLTGIDEPIFFTFVFVAPILWIYNAIFVGGFAAIAIAMHMHIGFGFSGGLIDYIISFPTAWGLSQWEGVVNGPLYGILSNPLWMPVLAAVMFPVYYFSFYFTIKKFDLQTPGREHDEPAASLGSMKFEKIEGIKASDKYMNIAKNLLQIIGDDNIVQIGHCSSRLRLIVKNNKVGNIADVRKAGGAGLLRISDNGLQVVIGTDVDHVANAMEVLLKNPSIKTVVIPDDAKQAPMKAVAKPAAKPVAKKEPVKKAEVKPVAKKAEVKAVAKKVVAKPAVKKAPATKAPAKPVAKKPVAKKPVAKKAPTNKPLTEVQKRALTDGSANIKESRQELQKKASALRKTAKQNKVKFVEHDLRDMTKKEVMTEIEYLKKTISK